MLIRYVNGLLCCENGNLSVLLNDSYVVFVIVILCSWWASWLMLFHLFHLF
jgi:hypothetical protein